MLLIRLVRVYRRVREHKVIGVAALLILVAVSVLGNATCYHLFEGRQAGHGFGDAIWYSVISITTIGYGDISAESIGARIGTIIFIVLLGLATFSMFLGMSIDWAAELAMKGERGMSRVFAKDHVLIVNFPSASRVSQLINELKSDPQHANNEIVIITDQIERLPFDEPNVLFVNGPVLEEETYQRAQIADANEAIVLATSYEQNTSDAVVASAVAVIDGLNPDIHIVAECLNRRHRSLFDNVNCNAVICSLQISGNLLVQEAHDPGVSQLVDVITSNVRGTTLYSTEVSDVSTDVNYLDLAKRLLDKDVNLLCVNRGEESLTSFVELKPQTGDRVIYATSNRRTWPGLLEVAGC